MNELWNLLWSRSQQAFHIEQVKYTVRTNQSAFLANRRMDYVTLLVGTEDECHAEADFLRPKLHEQQRMKAAANGVIEAILSRGE